MGTDTIKRIVFAVIITIMVVHFSYVVGRRDGFNSAVGVETEKTDTLFIRDTIMSNDPVFITKTKIDSIPYPVPVTDTLWKTDTIWLQREQVVWQDSLSCVYASGIMPQVDSVQHYISERIVTRELTKVVKKPCRWGLGIHAGYGVFYDKKFIQSPYVGVGISYNILSW